MVTCGRITQHWRIMNPPSLGWDCEPRHLRGLLTRCIREAHPKTRAEETRLLNLLSQSVTIQPPQRSPIREWYAMWMHSVRDEELGEWIYPSLGNLVRRAQVHPSPAQELADRMCAWIADHPRFRSAETVAAVPASSAHPTIYLPSYLASEVARRFGMSVVSITSTNREEQAGADMKLNSVTLAKAYAQNAPHSVRGRTVLVLDDLCETGGSMEATAMVLKQAGATEAFALAATKNAKACQGLTPSLDNWGNQPERYS